MQHSRVKYNRINHDLDNGVEMVYRGGGSNQKKTEYERNNSKIMDAGLRGQRKYGNSNNSKNNDPKHRALIACCSQCPYLCLVIPCAHSPPHTHTHTHTQWISPAALLFGFEHNIAHLKWIWNFLRASVAYVCVYEHDSTILDTLANNNVVAECVQRICVYVH